MATIGNGNATLVDIIKTTAPDGSILDVAEILSQNNAIIDDLICVEANSTTSHVESIRTGLPTVYWRQYNLGTPTSKATSAQVNEPMAMLESRSYVDLKLAALNNNSAAWRMKEDAAFVEAMGQEVVSKLFNGNVGVDMKTFSGLATRYSSTTAGNGQNVILAGGSGADNSSMYLVGWGKNSVFCTYPKGSTAGLSVRDLGEQAVRDASGNEFQALRTMFNWDIGLVVKDWRYACRIANIDVSDFVGVTGTQAATSATNVIKLMTKAIARMPSLSGANFAFYCNRSIGEGLMIQALEKSSAVLAIQPALTQFGASIMELKFMGIPVRIVDQLSIAETLVS